MFEKSMFPFSADKMMDMFKSMDMSKILSDMKIPSMKAEDLFAAQKKNMDALMEANKAAAAAYQDLFKRQVSIFEDMMEAAREQVKGFDASKLTPDGAQKQAEIARAAFEKAIGNMQALAEAAREANEKAFEIVSARVKESMAELSAMASKLKA
jgi:phasin family protein